MEKEKVTWGIDKELLDTFRKVCNRKGEKYSKIIEFFMVQYLKWNREMISKDIVFNKYIIKLIKEEGMKNE